MNRQGTKSAKYAKGILEPGKKTDALARSVIGAAIEVHRTLGPGFLESIYEEALGVELHLRGVPFERQVPLSVSFKGYVVGKQQLDLLVGGALIVELKTVEALHDVHVAQVISYLRATGYHLGLLINFNIPLLRDGIRRIVTTR